MFQLASLLKIKPEVQKYLTQNKLEAFRLYSGTNKDFPFVIDIFKDNAVIHILHSWALKFVPEIEKTLATTLHSNNFFYKDRTKQKIKVPSSQHKEIIVNEYGCKFSINLSDYLDVGLFLDHRETRKWIAEQAQGKVILNTFAYTGSFSVYAAMAGAAKTYSVDLSKTYCDWIRKNVELNNLPLEQNWIYKMDTFEFFRYANRKNLKFDIIIIDPPTFSKNKKLHFSVQKDHPQLLQEAAQLLNPKGFILFSNNFQNFRLEKEKLPSFSMVEKKDTVPPDFSGTFPHWCYVAGLK